MPETSEFSGPMFEPPDLFRPLIPIPKEHPKLRHQAHVFEFAGPLGSPIGPKPPEWDSLQWICIVGGWFPLGIKPAILPCWLKVVSINMEQRIL